jgi:hypothetical protein
VAGLLESLYNLFGGWVADHSFGLGDRRVR